MGAMEWVTIISVLAVIVGWFINSYLNRQHELFKRKMDLRFEMYDSCMEVAKTIERMSQANNISIQDKNDLESDFSDNVETFQANVLLYGTNVEISKANKIVKLAKSNKFIEMKTEFASLMQSIRYSLRRDLKLPKLHQENKR